MDKIELEPYLFFPGNCREAMTFYQKIFGGELNIMTYDEADPETPDDMKKMVMHADLKSNGLRMMASDSTDVDLKPQGRISLSLNGHDEAMFRKFYDDLSVDGTADHPLKEEFWGDIFGSLTDKFGNTWMINISSEHPETNMMPTNPA